MSEQSNPEDDADQLSKAQIVLIGATYVLPLKLENGTENDQARIAPLGALELARAQRNRSGRRVRYAIVTTPPQKTASNPWLSFPSVLHYVTCPDRLSCQLIGTRRRLNDEKLRHMEASTPPCADLAERNYYGLSGNERRSPQPRRSTGQLSQPTRCLGQNGARRNFCCQLKYRHLFKHSRRSWSLAEY